MTWPTFDRFKSSLSHILTGFIPFIIGSLLFGSLWVGAFAVLCVYWSREKCQHQYKLKGSKEDSDYLRINWIMRQSDSGNFYYKYINFINKNQ